jgi:hypothetical protein
MPQNDNNVCENAVDEKVRWFTAKFEWLHQAFETCEMSNDKFLCHIGMIKNVNQWESFVATVGGINAGHRANASIHVQPNTMCRRRDGVTRGSKRTAKYYVSQERWSDNGIQAHSHWKTSNGYRTCKISCQEIWQMRLAIINLMRNHMVLVIKDKIPCCLTSVVHDVAFFTEKIGLDVFFFN